MDDIRVSTLIGAEISDAIGNIGSEVTQERKDALEYYLSEPFGNEQEGRSSVISSDVHDVVEWILPSLMRTFCSSDQIVRFDARQESDIEAARQATDYVNFIITQDNEWTQIAYNWMKDALIQKVGIIKHMYETVEEYDTEMYEDLTDAEYALIASDPDFEILEHTEKSVETEVDVDEDDDALIEGMMTGTSHDVRGRRSSETGCVTIVNVPPEEFLISKDARTVDDATFVAHRVEKTVYELIGMGFDADQVENLPSYSSLQSSEERHARYSSDDDMDSGGDSEDDGEDGEEDFGFGGAGELPFGAGMSPLMQAASAPPPPKRAKVELRAPPTAADAAWLDGWVAPPCGPAAAAGWACSWSAGRRAVSRPRAGSARGGRAGAPRARLACSASPRMFEYSLALASRTCASSSCACSASMSCVRERISVLRRLATSCQLISTVSIHRRWPRLLAAATSSAITCDRRGRAVGARSLGGSWRRRGRGGFECAGGTRRQTCRSTRSPRCRMARSRTRCPTRRTARSCCAC